MELRLSGPRFDAVELERLLLALDLSASVQRQTQVVPGQGLEEGAVVQLFGCDKARLAEVWPALQRAFELRCAYVSVYDRGFHGCVLNYLAPSLCPLAPSSS